MLHPYQEALKIQIPLSCPVSEESTGRELLALLSGINSWLDAFPSVHGALEGKSVYILYRNAAFPVSDFWDSFGLTMAEISKTWPVSAYGTAQNQETVWLSSERKENCLYLIQHSISGKSADILESLCFQLDCPDNQTAQRLICLLKAMNWEIGIGAIGWQYADLPREQNLVLDPNFRSMFCYVGLDGEEQKEDCLLSLDFDQKIMLWTSFLKEGLEPVEFEWLEKEIREDSIIDRMEWELALREAMNRLGFHIINREKSFAVYDGNERRRYFGADYQKAAEWVLMKILFPLNYF